MRLYSWGANTYGQLSLGHCEDAHQIALAMIPGLPDDLSTDQSIEPLDIDGGANHTMLIDKKGSLFACGDNRNAQLLLPHPSGNDSLDSERRQIRFVRVMDGVASVACGWDFSVVAKRDGSVLHNSHQGGLFTSDFDGRRISKVSCGVHHGFALTEDHVLFGFGNNKNGELGSGTKDMNKGWIKVAEGVKDVKAGLNHSLLLMRDGTLKFLGMNRFKQSPPGTLLGNLILIGSGWNHTIVITEGSEGRDNAEYPSFHVHCYGKNDLGQLGHPDTALHCNCFALPFKPVDLRVGSEHVMVLFENGAVMVWGWNEHGTCARTPSLTATPKILGGLGGKAVLIGCTFAGCFALVE